jgi:uronate dehydrogenase
MNTPKCLLTGAAGRIGSAFWRTQQERFDLRLADIDVSHLAESKCEVVELDVTDPNSCLRACLGIETVIHLAADASPRAEFTTSLLPTNIVGTYNMFLAARDQGCKRIVFASSAQAVEGYPLDVQVQEGMPVRPTNLYGVSKAFGEALASFFAYESNLTTVAVRIANVAEFHAGEVHNARDVAAFISERDVVHLLARCIEADLSGFNVVHGVSNNRYKRLAIDHTRKILGYAPSDDSFVILTGMSEKDG